MLVKLFNEAFGLLHKPQVEKIHGENARVNHYFLLNNDYSYARSMRIFGDCDKAISILEEIIEKDPSFDLAYTYRGLTRLRNAGGGAA